MAIHDYEQPAGPDSGEKESIVSPTDGSIALGHTVEVIPIGDNVVPLHVVTPFEDFKTELHELIRGGDYPNKSLAELEDIKARIEEVRVLQTARFSELAKLEAVLQREMTWTNGYIIDLNKAIQEKQREEPEPGQV